MDAPGPFVLKTTVQMQMPDSLNKCAWLLKIYLHLSLFITVCICDSQKFFNTSKADPFITKLRGNDISEVF